MAFVSSMTKLGGKRSIEQILIRKRDDLQTRVKFIVTRNHCQSIIMASRTKHVSDKQSRIRRGAIKELGLSRGVPLMGEVGKKTDFLHDFHLLILRAIDKTMSFAQRSLWLSGHDKAMEWV